MQTIQYDVKTHHFNVFEKRIHENHEPRSAYNCLIKMLVVTE